jgi:MFS family permease
VLAPLGIQPFRRFWIGGAVSVFGDHLTFVALPWLVLKLTNDTLAMGTVIAVAAIPRALLMLFGGALTDRWSPRRVMLWSNVVRFLLVLALAGLTYAEAIDLTTIFVIAFCFGVADAFLFPAASTMPPRLLEEELLAAGNSLMQGTFQITLVLGPMIGGLLIAGLGDAAGDAEGLTDRVALATVFLLDAGTFLVSIYALATIRERFPVESTGHETMLTSIIDGLRWTWNDMPIRTFVLLMAAFTLVFRGPFAVGVPALANTHLTEGAAAFGTLMSALGVGAILGALLAGSTRTPDHHWIGKLLLIDIAIFGAIMTVMAYVHDLVILASVVLLGGILDGYIIVLITTWTQKHVPRERLGRVMSVVMFANQGFFPISSALAGAVAGWDLISMLLIGGGLGIALALVGVASRTVRRLGYE